VRSAFADPPPPSPLLILAAVQSRCATEALGWPLPRVPDAAVAAAAVRWAAPRMALTPELQGLGDTDPALLHRAIAAMPQRRRIVTPEQARLTVEHLRLTLMAARMLPMDLEARRARLREGTANLLEIEPEALDDLLRQWQAAEAGWLPAVDPMRVLNADNRGWNTTDSDSEDAASDDEEEDDDVDDDIDMADGPGDSGRVAGFMA